MLSFVFVAAASYITTTLRLSQLNQHTVMAIHYAEELQEWISTEQEDNWEQFTTRAATPPGYAYCFNNQITYSAFGSSWPAQESCDQTNLDYQGIQGTQPTIFNRELTLQQYGSPPTRVQSTVRVYWRELGEEHEIVSERVYSLFQQ
jgi:hypothetical protein